LYEAKCRRWKTKHSQETGQDDRGGFVTEIPQCTGDAGTGYGAVEPALRFV
jgi:hypothetical protein